MCKVKALKSNRYRLDMKGTKKFMYNFMNMGVNDRKQQFVTSLGKYYLNALNLVLAVK